MGRPRKRQYTGETKDSNIDFDSVIPDFDPLPQYEEYIPIDPYLDANTLSFPNDETGQFRIPPDKSQTNGPRTANDGRVVFHFGGNEFKKPIDFNVDEGNFGEPPAPVNAIVTEAPHESHKHHIFDRPHPSSSTPGPPCSCLASMYLSMASLQEFPSDVETALSTVRVAANTAQASIRCEKCGTGAAVQLRPPIESFQNTMLLGTILPIIANGYKRLLIMVDGETNTAKAAGLKKVFRMTAYGGVYGIQGLCESVKHLDETVMEPDEWRYAVRGLLRADVYGLEGMSTGLRGIVAEMEQRQRSRHKLLDHIVDNGHDDGTGPTRCIGEKDMLCLRILDSAKVAVDSLVIA